MNKLLGFILFHWSFFAVGQEMIPFGELESLKPISQYSIKEWSMNNGLPNNAIMDIEKTSEGFMWLATFNGLTRFDGIEFKVYNRSNTPEFTTNSISSLVVDQDNVLWVGTNGGGLVKFAQGKFKRIKTDSINGSIITTLAVGQPNELWIGTRAGLAKLENNKLFKFGGNDLTGINVTTLFYDIKQRLWIGTATQGLFILDDSGIMNLGSRHGLESDFIRAVFVDSKDNVWVGTDRGVSIINSSGIHSMDSVAGAPYSFTNSFLEDSDGNIWLASNDGLRRFNKTFEKVDPEREVGYHVVQSLYHDDEHNVWAGTYRVGLHRLNQSKFLLLGEYEGLVNEVINVTYSDDSVRWVGTDDGLIYLRDGIIQTFRTGSRSGGNRIRDIFRDSRGRLWLCTYRGLLHFDKGKVVKSYGVSNGLCSMTTRRIVEDYQGNLWIGTANGLSRFKDGKFTSFGTESGLNDTFIMSLLVDKTGMLWVGTNGGGTYKLEEGHFKKVLSAEANNDIVFNMVQDNQGAVWLSTNRGAIFLQDSLEFCITPQHGLPSNNIFQVLPDDSGEVWFASDYGIMRVSREEVVKLVSGETNSLHGTRVFDRSDGLRTGEITPASKTARSTDGEIWFCTLQGVAVLESDRIPTNNIPANVLVTNILTDQQEYPVNQKAVIPAGNRRLVIHYAGLSFYAPEKVQYKFKLENFDQNWVNAGSRRTAYYTNLPPGEYEFKVMAANNDGLWSEIPAIVPFTQQAFFYQTRWFYVLVGLFLIAFGAFLYYIRARGLRHRNLHLARIVQERTRDIQYRNQAIIVQREELKQLNTVKDKLLSVISHDLRGPIAAVSGLLGLLKSGHLNYQELIIQSNRLNNEVHNLTYLLDNLLSWSKSQMHGIKLNKETVQLSKVVEQNLTTVHPLSAQKQISIFNRVPGDCYVHTDVNFLGLVIRNLLMNAIKFTHEKGEISITSEYLDDQVIISVNDNGIGMSDEDLNKLFNEKSHYSKMGTANEAGTGLGLLLCKEFLDLEGGRIWAVSEKGVGSSFKFILKRGKPQAVDSK